MNLAFFNRAERAQSPSDADAGVGQLYAPAVAPAASPAAVLAGLMTHRDHVHNELGRFGKVDEARIAAEAALAQLDAEQEAIDRDEAEAARKWALEPDGDLPAPLTSRRQELAQRRAAASATLASAINAGRAVDERRSALHAELRQIGDDIFDLKIRALADEARDLNNNANELAAELVESAQQFDSIRLAMMHLRGDAVNSKNDGRAEMLTAQIDAIESLKRPTLTGDPAALDRLIHGVKGRLAA